VTITAIHTCNHCGRQLKRESLDGLGPVCRRSLTGANARGRISRRRPAVVREADPRQMLIPGVAA
jgi:hypothetical protein